MQTVSARDFQLKIGHYQNRALVEPVMVTRNGRERLVLMSVEEYRRLKRRDRQVIGLEDFTEADLEELRKVKPSKAAAAFNHEVPE